jgi:hypothetical protein
VTGYTLVYWRHHQLNADRAPRCEHDVMEAVIWHLLASAWTAVAQNLRKLSISDGI